MTYDQHFRTDTTEVSFERFEDETVAVHFETGNYYSLNRSADVVWDLIIKGLSLNEVMSAMQLFFSDYSNAFEKDIEEFVQILLKEKLIVHMEEGIAASDWIPSNGGPLIPYEKPKIETFSDMKDLLLLDPIHDVDETGWPSPR